MKNCEKTIVSKSKTQETKSLNFSNYLSDTNSWLW